MTSVVIIIQLGLQTSDTLTMILARKCGARSIILSLVLLIINTLNSRNIAYTADLFTEYIQIESCKIDPKVNILNCTISLASGKSS